MSIKIPNPQTKSFKQIGNSDVLGNIWSSFNLDLTENLGRIRVSGRGMIVDSSAAVSSLTNLQTPVVFKHFIDRIWCIAGARIFSNSGDPDDVFVQDATASTPTTLNSGCDMEVFFSSSDESLYVAGDGNLRQLDNTGTWSVISTIPAVSNCSMCVFRGRLYVSEDVNQIYSMNYNEVVTFPTAYPNTNAYTLLLNYGEGQDENNNITSIRASSDRIWIATVNYGNQGGNQSYKGKIFEWDGVSTNVTKSYELESFGALALIIKDDIPYIVDVDGKLLKFNGSSFQEVARLPVPSSQFLKTTSVGTPSQRFIHPRGISIRNNKIVMLINNVNSDNSTFNENLPSGIWEYDENIGLYHKTSCSISPVGFSTRTDYAQNRLSEVGGMLYVKSSSSSDNDADLIWGAKYYTDATNTAYGIFCNNTLDDQPKVGYLVSTKIESNNVQDAWQKAYVKFKRLLNPTDRIALKYRTFETTPLHKTITWTSTTTFTATGLSTISVGDEVEVTRGTGGGQIEHITSIVDNSGTYTVTLENAVVGASGTATARFQKWIKIRDTSDQTIDYTECPIGVKSNWIQLKLVMYFTGKDEVNEIELINSTFKPSV